MGCAWKVERGSVPVLGNKKAILKSCLAANEFDLSFPIKLKCGWRQWCAAGKWRIAQEIINGNDYPSGYV